MESSDQEKDSQRESVCWRAISNRVPDSHYALGSMQTVFMFLNKKEVFKQLKLLYNIIFRLSAVCFCLVLTKTHKEKKASNCRAS